MRRDLIPIPPVPTPFFKFLCHEALLTPASRFLLTLHETGTHAPTVSRGDRLGFLEPPALSDFALLVDLPVSA